ncbi:unnamed protein product [Allacma fusca]|uniref:G-protein coupled receptors family 1 profile domain-containing protein n=1 Tax=Allacma fusca TaxID=39272 RepID=A0A8J2KDF5_9HEXA|nr:unnamed protein product [Allacma fusca]
MDNLKTQTELASGLGTSEWSQSKALTDLFKLPRIGNKTRRLFNASIVEDDEDYILDSPTVKTTLITVYSLVFFFCFFGNLTVILVIKLHWRMKSVTKFCLGNLAFANLCVGIFCVYQNLSLYLIDSWVFGEFLCKMYHFINTLSHTASILILVVITIERYLVIMYPFKCRRVLTIQRLRGIVIGVWILSAIISSPRLYFIELIPNPTYWKKTEGQRTGIEVLCTLGKSAYTSKTVDMIQFVTLFCIPLLIMTVLYTKITLFLRKRDTLARFYAITYGPRSDNDMSSSHTEVSTEDLSTRSFKFSKTHNQSQTGSRSRRQKFERTSSLEESKKKKVSKKKKRQDSSSAVISIEDNPYCEQCVNQVFVGKILKGGCSLYIIFKRFCFMGFLEEELSFELIVLAWEQIFVEALGGKKDEGK